MRLQVLTEKRLVCVWVGSATKTVLFEIPIEIRVIAEHPSRLDFWCYQHKSLAILNTWAKTIQAYLRGQARPFEVLLEVRGLGYKATAPKPTTIELILGYSHTVIFHPPTGVEAATVGIKQRTIRISGKDWVLLTQTAASIQKLRKMNAYKEKGIFRKWSLSQKLRISKRKKN